MPGYGGVTAKETFQNKDECCYKCKLTDMKVNYTSVIALVALSLALYHTFKK